MQAMRIQKIAKKDGEIVLTGLPCNKGQRVEMIVLMDSNRARKRRPLTGRDLLKSGLIGLWKHRKDIGDSAAYARQLRDQAQKRREEP